MLERQYPPRGPGQGQFSGDREELGLSGREPVGKGHEHVQGVEIPVQVDASTRDFVCGPRDAVRAQGVDAAGVAEGDEHGRDRAGIEDMQELGVELVPIAIEVLPLRRLVAGESDQARAVLRELGDRDAE